MLETKINTKKTAVICIDMQKDCLQLEVNDHYRGLAKYTKDNHILENTAKIIAAARKAGMPIIYVRHHYRKDKIGHFARITDRSLAAAQKPAVPPVVRMIEGTVGTEVCDEIKPQPGDFTVFKTRSNAFYDTNLEIILRSQGIDTLILCGFATGGCIHHISQGCGEHDINPIFVPDCSVPHDEAEQDFLVNKQFPKEGRVRTSDEVVAAIS